MKAPSTCNNILLSYAHELIKAGSMDSNVSMTLTRLVSVDVPGYGNKAQESILVQRRSREKLFDALFDSSRNEGITFTFVVQDTDAGHSLHIVIYPSGDVVLIYVKTHGKAEYVKFFGLPEFCTPLIHSLVAIDHRHTA